MFKILTMLLLTLFSTHLSSSESTHKRAQERMMELVGEEGLQEFNEDYSNLPEEQKELLDAFFGSDWKYEGRYKLPMSHSTLSLPEGHMLLIGEEARKLRELMGEKDSEIEAVVLDDNFKDDVIFCFSGDGYVSIDDWQQVDSKELLKSIRELTEEANKERRKIGIGELHVVGWIQEPTLDRHTNTVYWAIEGLEEDGGSMVNSMALRLGRSGYELITWVSDKESHVNFGGKLDVMLRAHSFDPGFRYKDYTTGDKVAGYGIATLVAGIVGGKVVKAGGIAVLLKKFGSLIFAALAAGAYKLKGLFGRKGDE